MVPAIPKLLQALGCALLVVGQKTPGEAGQGLMDLPCSSGKNSQAWQGVKKNFRGLFGTGAVFLGLEMKTLTSTLDKTMQELRAVDALSPQTESECAAGKLSLQMLSVNTITDPMALAQLHSGMEKFGSPILTMLLDVPFVAIAESGWPVFGFLAQLNWSRRRTELANEPEADGLTKDVSGAFYAELTQALLAGNLKELREVSGIYLNLQDGDNALGALTALAAQAALEPNPPARIQLLEILQTTLKQAIGSAAELDYALGTQWPLWGLLHEAVDGLATPLMASASS